MVELDERNFAYGRCCVVVYDVVVLVADVVDVDVAAFGSCCIEVDVDSRTTIPPAPAVFTSRVSRMRRVAAAVMARSASTTITAVSVSSLFSHTDVAFIGCDFARCGVAFVDTLFRLLLDKSHTVVIVSDAITSLAIFPWMDQGA